jgi:hypothetical protein
VKYCPECGTSHECVTEQRDLDRTAVEIKRLETNRDIEVARLQAGAAKHIADAEAEHSADYAEGRAEGVTETLEAVSGGGDPAPEPAGEPIVVEAGEEDEDGETEDDVTPPVVVPEPAEPKAAGWWSGYAASRR